MEPEPSDPLRESHLAWLEGEPRLDAVLLHRFAVPLLEQIQRCLEGSAAGSPPVIALNGPVGAGKSSLAAALCTLAARGGMALAVASIDDFYLPLAERRARLAGNPFGVARVPPGSHDVELLLELLERWPSTGILRLPRFDKSRAGGLGERAGWRQERADALLLEGWLMGCRPLGPQRLRRALEEGAAADLTDLERQWLPRWDRQLEAYLPLWERCEGLWLLRPASWTLPRRWRFQAEARQRRQGGGWLAPPELDALVRSSLHSLPPELYQDPLLGDPRLRGLAVLDGRRRWVAGRVQPSSSSLSSAIG